MLHKIHSLKKWFFSLEKKNNSNKEYSRYSIRPLKGKIGVNIHGKKRITD